MRSVVTFLIWSGVAYGAFVIFVYAFQSRLLYLPNIAGTLVDVTPTTIGARFDDLRIPTSDGLTLHAWFVAAADSDRVVLFCHGNAGNISHRLDSIRIFHQLGLDVLIFDYRGYGQSDGRPSEAGTYLDVEAAWSYLIDERGYDPDRIIVFGRSMGAAIAAHLAANMQPGALILESAFTSAPDLAARHYWYLPVRLLSRFSYATVDHVGAVRAPTLVVHSPGDEIVPVEHGRRIFAHANEPKTFLEIIGDHNTGFFMSGALYSEGIKQFVDTAVPPGVRPRK
ncbi:MAG: alpha/beta hydrolase [Gammaproteobacteria bacterium]